MRKVIFLFFAVILITACSSVKLVNHGLTANPSEVQKGGKTTLTWNLKGEGKFQVYIMNATDGQIVFDNLPMKGSKEITLNTTTTFMLHAKNANGMVKLSGESEVTVKVK